MTYPINQSQRPDPACVACPTAHPHKTIPSPWSSKCHMPLWQAPWINPITPFQPVPPHRHKSNPLPCSSQCRMSPWNNSIAPIQPLSHIPMIQSHRTDPASDLRPHGTPPHIDSITPIQSGDPMTHPCKSTHRPDTASVVCHHDTPHKSIPSPDPASFKFPFKCLNLTKITNWSDILKTFFEIPMNNNE